MIIACAAKGYKAENIVACAGNWIVVVIRVCKNSYGFNFLSEVGRKAIGE